MKSYQLIRTIINIVHRSQINIPNKFTTTGQRLEPLVPLRGKNRDLLTGNKFGKTGTNSYLILLVRPTDDFLVTCRAGALEGTLEYY